MIKDKKPEGPPFLGALRYYCVSKKLGLTPLPS